MPDQPTTILAILNGTASLVGAYVAARAYRAYRRTRVRFLLVLAAGFAVLIFGLVVEGFVFEVLGWPLARAHVLEATFNVVAFVILAASLHLPSETRSEPLHDEAPETETDEPP